MNYQLTNFAISVAILAFYWFYIDAQSRRESFRCDIRKLRDDLFDFMYQNGIDFRNEAYRTTRNSLNGMLHLSNRMSPLLFFTLLTIHTDLKRHGYSFSDGMKGLKNDALRDQIKYVRSQAGQRLIDFVFAEGITGALVQFILVLVGLVRGIGRVRNWATQQGDSVFLEANRFLESNRFEQVATC